MPTIEERLAALETKLAALTETTPTTYYEHQYSGEEIDNAVSRALPNGAIDQSVGTFVRPNLLDNAYFLNPVDQRGGYIVPKGVNYYKVDGWVLQGPIPETVRVDYIDESGSARFDYGGVPCYVPKDGGYVRGYTDNGYTIDRWKMQQDIGIILLEADGIILDATANALTLVQFFNSDLLRELAGNTLTWSVMYTVLEQSGNPGGIGYTIPGNYFAQAIMSGAAGKLCVAYGSAVCPDNLETPAQMYIPKGCKIKLLAVKLELGSTQTLAHREGDKWVLNEVPEYGEQLRRCQRYAIKIGKDTAGDSSLVGFALCTSSTLASAFISLPVSMRTKPIVTFKNVYLSLGSSVVAVTNITVYENTQNGIYCALSVSGGLTVGQTVAIRTSDGGYIMPSADL